MNLLSENDDGLTFGDLADPCGYALERIIESVLALGSVSRRNGNQRTVEALGDVYAILTKERGLRDTPQFAEIMEAMLDGRTSDYMLMDIASRKPS